MTLLMNLLAMACFKRDIFITQLRYVASLMMDSFNVHGVLRASLDRALNQGLSNTQLHIEHRSALVGSLSTSGPYARARMVSLQVIILLYFRATLLSLALPDIAIGIHP